MVSAISNMDPSINRLIAAASGNSARTRNTDRVGPTAAPHESARAEAIGKSELTEEEKQQVEELEKRDQEVRRHEQAHKAAAGQHARGGASYEYQTGPDGRRYAIGGEVSIDTSPVSGDPQATIAKAQQIRRAATAPAEPSGQDRKVAAKAAALEQQARQELAEQDVNGPAESGAAQSGNPSKNGATKNGGDAGAESPSDAVIHATTSTNGANPGNAANSANATSNANAAYSTNAANRANTTTNTTNSVATSEAATQGFNPRNLTARPSPGQGHEARTPRSIYENASQPPASAPVGRYIDVAA